MKKFLSVLLILSTICFSGCAEIEIPFAKQDSSYSQQQKVFTLAENFCFALSDDDIETAEGYLHPDSPLCNGNLEPFLSDMEQENEIDFSRGVAFRNREIVSSYRNNQGSTYIFYLKVVVDGKIIRLSFKVLHDEKGLGIYTFEKYVFKG